MRTRATRWRHDRGLAAAAGVIVLGWLAVEVAIIGYVSWMQPATAAAGAMILVLGWRLQPSTGLRRLRRKLAA